MSIKPTTILAPYEAEHEAVNFSRTNKGSRWDRIGDNELIDADQWRYNYNPDTGIFEGRTIMGQWTNEILDPRDMTTANWGDIQANVTRDQVGIDGEPNAACSIIGTEGTSDRVEQIFSVPDDGSSHTFAVFTKKNTGSYRMGLVLSGGVGSFSLSEIDTNNGTTSDTATIEDAGDWWLVWDTITNNSSGNTSLELYLYAPDGAVDSAIYDCAQVFLNRSSPPPTPVYGETAGQSYTQDPEIATVATLSDINYNADEATFSIEFYSAYSEGTLFDLHTDANNRIYAHRNASNEVHLLIVDGGVTQADLNLGTIADNTAGKIAVGWKANDISGALNGGTVQTDTTATIPAVTDLNIGRDYNDANYWDAFIGEELNYPRKLTNSQIQDESKL